MPTQNKAVTAILAIKSRRFSLVDIRRYILNSRGLEYSVSHLSRISSMERLATPELTNALIDAARVMK